MKTLTCPCCGGKGRIELLEPVPVRLAKFPSQLYRLVKAKPSLLGAPQLVEALYADDPNGGPDDALKCVHVAINRMNKHPARVGEKIKADHRGPGATYSVVSI